MAKLDGERVVLMGGASGVSHAAAEAALADGVEVVVGSFCSYRSTSGCDYLMRASLC